VEGEESKAGLFRTKRNDLGGKELQRCLLFMVRESPKGNNVDGRVAATIAKEMAYRCGKGGGGLPVRWSCGNGRRGLVPLEGYAPGTKITNAMKGPGKGKKHCLASLYTLGAGNRCRAAATRAGDAANLFRESGVSTAKELKG